jgi:hypothetical protein
LTERHLTGCMVSCETQYTKDVGTDALVDYIGREAVACDTEVDPMRADWVVDSKINVFVGAPRGVGKAHNVRSTSAPRDMAGKEGFGLEMGLHESAVVFLANVHLRIRGCSL